MKALLFFFLSMPAFAGVIGSISTDKVSYHSGEKAILRVRFLTIPENPVYEFDAVATLNNAALTLDRPTDYEMYTTTAPLTAGSYQFQADLVSQDKNYARDLKASVVYYTQQIARVDDLLAHTTNPTDIANLQAERAKYVSLQGAAQLELANIRTVIESPTINFIVQ